VLDEPALEANSCCVTPTTTVGEARHKVWPFGENVKQQNVRLPQKRKIRDQSLDRGPNATV
jgi:hypothetical protein